MKMTGNKYLSLTFALSVTFSAANAAPLTIPNTFVSGTKAKAAEVNQNFSAAKDAINSNSSDILSLTSRVNALESQPAAPGLKVRSKSNNEFLGYVIETDGTFEVDVITPKGYLARLHQDGIYSYPFKLLFSGLNCTGTAYAEILTGGGARGPLMNGFMGNSLGMVFEGEWAIPPSEPNSADAGINGASYMGGYSCTNSAWSGIGKYYSAIPNNPTTTGVPSPLVPSNYKLTFD